LGRTLTTRELNRAVLERQLLLRRRRLAVDRAVERVAGLQSQYAPSPYIRLWSSLEGFTLGDLTGALERRRVVQATLMRSTIHIVSAGDFWLLAAGVGPSRQEWWLRTQGGGDASGFDLDAAAATLRATLAGRVWPRKELDAVLAEMGSSVWAGVWVPMVRVPPSGTWERRRADRFQLAEEWLGPSDAGEDLGLEHLLRRYLGGFGPATLGDAASWAGVPSGRLAEASLRLRLRTFLGPDGTELIDLPRAPLPPADTPAPPRFLGTWDAALLVHCRRALIIPEEYRPRIFHTKAPQSYPTFLVDGSVRGTWKTERSGGGAMLRIEPFERLPKDDVGALKEEAAGLIRFVEPDAETHEVTVARAG
jgi:Winged helix DNA-binding domain